MGIFSGLGKVAGKVVGAVTGGLSGGTQSTEATTSYGINAGDTVLLIPINNGQKFAVVGRFIYAADFTSSDTSTTTAVTGAVIT